MSRKSRAQRPGRSPRPTSSDAAHADTAQADTSPASAAPERVDTGDSDGTEAAPASMRDAMRAALDAKASRQGHTAGSGPRGGSDGPSGRGGGAKGFRALPRRSAG